MSTYSAGLLNVTTLDATGASAVLTANTATVTTLNADVVTTQDLTLTNLTIPTDGTFDIEGLNIYEGTYTAGDLISYTLKGTMTVSDASSYWAADPAYTGANNLIYLPDSSYNIAFYEMVYWGIDTRSNDTTRMSATVCIPSTIISPTIVSFKHGTLANTYQFFTLWREMERIKAGIRNYYNSPEIAPWILATTGYVTVCADNPGYGVGVGTYNYGEPTAESQSQFNAIVALKQLIEKRPALFNGASFVAPIDVISTGYSLGSNFCPLVSELIRLNSADFNLVNTIPGGVINAYKLLEVCLSDSSGALLTTNQSFNVLYLTLLLGNTNTQLYSPLFSFKPSISYGVVPMLQNLYLDTTRNNGINSPYGLTPRLVKFIQRATNNEGVRNYLGAPYLGDYPNPAYAPYSVVLYFKPSEIGDSFSPNLQYSKLGTFFTNIFEDFTDLSGPPINVMYSLQDTLACYNPADPYLVNPANGIDRNADPLAAFITTDSSYNGGFNGLSRASYTDTQVDASQNGLITQMQTVADVLTASEGGGTCSNTRWNTASLAAAQGHGDFSDKIYQTVLRKYLTSRLD